MIHYNADLAYASYDDLGEGPIWDAEQQQLTWVDITGKRLHVWQPASGRKDAFEIGHYVGSAVPRQGGGMLLVLEDGFYGYDLERRELKPLIAVEADKPDNRFNDGKCDAGGRFWAGTMHLHEHSEAGALYRLDPDLTVRPVIAPVTTSNGIAWSPDNRVMYYIDSPTKEVRAYDYDLQTGELSGERTVVRIPEGEGTPDGMTVDEAGMLWVAEWDGYCVSRWNPADGSRLAVVKLPAARVTSCMFGGPDLSELYITTARIGIAEEQLKNEPLAGCLFVARPGMRGLPEHKFRG